MLLRALSICLFKTVRFGTLTIFLGSSLQYLTNFQVNKYVLMSSLHLPWGVTIKLSHMEACGIQATQNYSFPDPLLPTPHCTWNLHTSNPTVQQTGLVAHDTGITQDCSICTLLFVLSLLCNKIKPLKTLLESDQHF